MDTTKQLAFAEMLHTRFCHDMAGPVSAVNNGLEFFETETDKDMREQALDLMKLSARESFIKLQMYRMAYGRANRATETSVEEIREISSHYFEHGKISLDWLADGQDGFGERINSETRQLLVNMIMLVASFLVFGGTLSVRKTTQQDSRTIIISGHFTRAKEDADILDIVQGKGNEKEYSPSNIPAFFLYDLAQTRNIKLSAVRKDDSITLSAQYS